MPLSPQAPAGWLGWPWPADFSHLLWPGSSSSGEQAQAEAYSRDMALGTGLVRPEPTGRGGDQSSAAGWDALALSRAFPGDRLQGLALPSGRLGAPGVPLTPSDLCGCLG